MTTATTKRELTAGEVAYFEAQFNNEDHRALLVHVSRFGSAGYPVRKAHSTSKRWLWSFRGLGSRMLYRTKREAVAAFEAYHAGLVNISAGRGWFEGDHDREADSKIPTAR